MLLAAGAIVMITLLVRRVDSSGRAQQAIRVLAARLPAAEADRLEEQSSCAEVSEFLTRWP